MEMRQTKILLLCFKETFVETPYIIHVFPSFYYRELFSFRSVISSVKNIIELLSSGGFIFLGGFPAP